MRFGLALCFCAAMAGARDLATIRKEGTIRVGTEGTLVPFNYFKDNVLTGFEVELANHLFQKMKLKAAWKTEAFASLLIGLNNDAFDLTVASHAITQERMAAVDFLTPHYCSGPVIITRPGGPTTRAALAQKRVAAKVGTIYFSLLQRDKRIMALSLPNNADLVQALLSKSVDAIILNEFAAKQMQEKHPTAQLRLGEMLMSESLGMAVKKGNTSLRDALDQELVKSLADGTYKALSEKYFGRDIRCEP